MSEPPKNQTHHSNHLWLFHSFFPRITSEVTARWVIESAVGVSFIIAFITAFLAVLHIAGFTIFNLIDAVFFFIVGILLTKSNRVAAMAGFFIYLSEALFAIYRSTHVNVLSLLVILLITLIYVNAIRGTHYIHKGKKRT